MEVTSSYRRGIERWIKDPFCGLSHAAGALLAVAGLFVLLNSAIDATWETIAVSVYGTSLVLIYTASALAHSVHCSPKLALRLDQLDYMAIFLLIAGTYTPICLGPLNGPLGWTLLTIEWGMALAGIVAVIVLKDRQAWIRLAMYGIMGCLVFFAIQTLWHKLSAESIGWLLGGGLCYSVGGFVFAAKRPDLWPGRFSYHDLWHVLALLGSGCHFMLIANLVT